MEAVVSAITAWKDLIIKVFGEYPLAAALMTLAGVGAFYALEKSYRPKQAATNILIVLLGWAVAVPIVGGVLWVIGQVWDVVKAVAPALTTAVTSLFGIYEKHPLLVLALVTIAVVVYFAWKRFRPKVLPSRGLRVIVLAALVLVVSHLASPIADMFTPKVAEDPVAKAPSPSAPALRASASAAVNKPLAGASSTASSVTPTPPPSSSGTAAPAIATSTAAKSTVSASAPK